MADVEQVTRRLQVANLAPGDAGRGVARLPVKLIVAASIGRPQEMAPPRALGFQVANERGDIEALTIEPSPNASVNAPVSPATYSKNTSMVAATRCLLSCVDDRAARVLAMIVSQDWSSSAR